MTLPVELGAEFLHGLPPELWALVEEAGLEACELEGSFVRFDGQRVVSAHERSAGFGVLEQMFAWSEAQPRERDLSFAEYLQLAGVGAADAAQATYFVESFNAADANRIGVAALAMQQRAEDAIDGGRAAHLRRGYAQLPQFLASKLQSDRASVLLGHRVERVSWRPHAVALSGTHASGERFEIRARRAIVTLPLGVLQSNAVNFDPVPQELLQHARRLVMGTARRLTLAFQYPFWHQLERLGARADAVTALQELSFLFTRQGMPLTWWTRAPDPVPLLTAWSGGANAARLETQLGTPGAVERWVGQCLETLAQVCGVPATKLRSLLSSWHTHDWQADVCALGAYSYAAPHALDASLQMTQPVADTLFFAGEHTDTSGHWGTVHAAMRSGLRAAAQLRARG
jgi:hypothetical protein